MERGAIAAWREELEVKLRSQGVRGVMLEAYSEGKGSLQAAKWLADKGWTEKRTAGRPSNEELAGERKQRANLMKSWQVSVSNVLILNKLWKTT
jgi:hypothetical protein